MASALGLPKGLCIRGQAATSIGRAIPKPANLSTPRHGALGAVQPPRLWALSTQPSARHTCLSAQEPPSTQELVGEDAAVFSVEKQTTKSWVTFTVLLSIVLAAIYAVSGPNSFLGALMHHHGMQLPVPRTTCTPRQLPAFSMARMARQM